MEALRKHTYRSCLIRSLFLCMLLPACYTEYWRVQHRLQLISHRSQGNCLSKASLRALVFASSEQTCLCGIQLTNLFNLTQVLLELLQLCGKFSCCGSHQEVQDKRLKQRAAGRVRACVRCACDCGATGDDRLAGECSLLLLLLASAGIFFVLFALTVRIVCVLCLVSLGWGGW